MAYPMHMQEPRYPRLHRALKWTVKLHHKQDRDGADALPYATHPVEVLTLLRFTGGITDEDMLCAALLHDLVEECGVSLTKIEKRYGVRVKDLVKELTRSEPGADEAATLSPEELSDLRSKTLLNEIGSMSADAQAIKLADRLSNIKGAMNSRTGASLQRYVDQTRKILQIIPAGVNKALWNAVNDQVPKAAGLTEPQGPEA
jgi:(p)ppGpp synthase/HD superfamily hydrolase